MNAFLSKRDSNTAHRKLAIRAWERQADQQDGRSVRTLGLFAAILACVLLGGLYFATRG